jgi:phosphate transport system substrate-binding protein
MHTGRTGDPALFHLKGVHSMLKLRTRRIAAAGVAALAGAAAVTAVAVAKSSITMSGSTSVAPLAAKLARGYLKAFPNSVRFRLLQGGSNIGISDVAHGRVTIGNSSRDPQASDPGGIVFNRIARDAICVVTHPSNRLGNLNQDQIKAIFSGQVRDWSQVPGATVSGTINVNVRTAASGTHDAFQKLFLGSAKETTTASQRGSNGLVQQAVSSDPNAIGYVSLAFTKHTNPVAFKGVTCNLRNAKAGQYEGTRNFYMVTRGNPVGAAAKWIRWILRSRAARGIISTEWVPA